MCDLILDQHRNIFERMRVELKEKWAIKDMLITPVQRITKYHLLLKDVVKYTEKIQGQLGGEDVEAMRLTLETMAKIPLSGLSIYFLNDMFI